MDLAHLPGAIAGWAFLWLSAGLGADAVAVGAALGAGYGYLLFAAEDGFLKGEGNVIVDVSAALWCLAAGGGYPAKEGIKYIAEAAKVNVFKALPPGFCGKTMPKAVIGDTPFRVREDFIGFIYLFELLRRLIITVVVRVILKGKPAECPLYFLVRSASRDAEDFIIITLYWHILYFFKFALNGAFSLTTLFARGYLTTGGWLLLIYGSTNLLHCLR
jgi:hypothetical protein